MNVCDALAKLFENTARSASKKINARMYLFKEAVFRLFYLINKHPGSRYLTFCSGHLLGSFLLKTQILLLDYAA